MGGGGLSLSILGLHQGYLFWPVLLLPWDSSSCGSLTHKEIVVTGLLFQIHVSETTAKMSFSQRKTNLCSALRQSNCKNFQTSLVCHGIKLYWLWKAQTYEKQAFLKSFNALLKNLLSKVLLHKCAWFSFAFSDFCKNLQWMVIEK